MILLKHFSLQVLKMEPTQTSNNQEVLRLIGNEIGIPYVGQKEPTIWGQISYYLPKRETAGKQIGEMILQRHGQEWSNQTIEFAVDKFFEPRSATSIWDYFYQIPQPNISEVAKMAIAHKVVPVMSLLAGIGGQLPLPLITSLVGIVYDKVMHNPIEVQQLSKLELHELFTIDPETRGLRDGFGRLLTEKDTRGVLAATAKYHLVARLIQLCQEIDKKYGALTTAIEEGLNEELTLDSIALSNPERQIENKLREDVHSLIEELMKSYYIKRSDEIFVFPSGLLITEKHHRRIREAIAVLESLNLTYSKKELSKAIRLLGEQSIFPMKYLQGDELKERILSIEPMVPLRMPSVFQGEDQWKNHIVRAEDGIYFLSEDSSGRQAGLIVSSDEMIVILTEMTLIQAENDLKQLAELKALLNEKKYEKLVDCLNVLPSAKICSFLKQQLIENKEKAELFYLDGQRVETECKQKLLKAIITIPALKDIVARKKELTVLVQLFGSHFSDPSDYEIKYGEGGFKVALIENYISNGNVEDVK